MKDKWCIEITEDNKHILKPYWESKVSKRIQKDFSFAGFLISDKFDGTYLLYGSSCEYGDSEITIEQFQKEILEKNVEPNYEIY